MCIELCSKRGTAKNGAVSQNNIHSFNNDLPASPIVLDSMLPHWNYIATSMSKMNSRAVLSSNLKNYLY